MKSGSHDCVLELLPAQVLRLHAASGVTIDCDGGTLWVTQEGLLRDDFLSAGESLRITSAGVTLIEAVGRVAAGLTLRSRQMPGHQVRIFQVRTAF
jgi:hypothetical protein